LSIVSLCQACPNPLAVVSQQSLDDAWSHRYDARPDILDWVFSGCNFLDPEQRVEVCFVFFFLLFVCLFVCLLFFVYVFVSVLGFVVVSAEIGVEYSSVCGLAFDRLFVQFNAS
jgi:hypothetical protein